MVFLIHPCTLFPLTAALWLSEFQVNRSSVLFSVCIEPGHHVLIIINALNVDRSRILFFTRVLSFSFTLTSLLLLFLHLCTPSFFRICPLKCAGNYHKQMHKEWEKKIWSCEWWQDENAEEASGNFNILSLGLGRCSVPRIIDSIAIT